MKLFDEIEYQRDVLLSRINHARDLPKDIFILLIITLVAIGAFLLGRISAGESARTQELRITGANHGAQAIQRTSSESPTTGAPTVSLTQAKGQYVGSISGTTYHLPWCSGAKRIREENKIWFASKEEAAAKGYKPAANCKGI